MKYGEPPFWEVPYLHEEQHGLKRKEKMCVFVLLLHLFGAKKPVTQRVQTSFSLEKCWCYLNESLNFSFLVV